MGQSHSSSSSSSSSSGGYRDTRCSALRAFDEYVGSQARGHNTSDFCDPKSLVDHLQPGDIVQKKGNWLPQYFYSHYAVYVGNGDVIHIVKSGPAERGPLVEVFCGELVRKNNLHDNYLPPQPRPQIVFDARSWLDKHWDYNPVTNNCEHFATLCRYGQKTSLQCLGFGDVWRGRVGLGEYARNVVNSAKQACSTVISCAKRKIFGSVTNVGSKVLSIMGW